MAAASNQQVPAASNAASRVTAEDLRIAYEQYGIINPEVVCKNEKGELTYRNWMTLKEYVNY